jgi:hypothetical protein
MHLILPKTDPVMDIQRYRNMPMFFLAGPILGGGDWHLPMSQLLMGRFNKLIVVNPSRYTPAHQLYPYRMGGAEDGFQHQTHWERYYLEQAAEKWPTGCIIFWLACESKSSPRTDGQPYAMDTRGEIGEWRGRLMYTRHQRIVMGAEKDFPGLRQIKRNFELALGSSFPIHDTMEEVVERAAQFVHRNFSNTAAQPPRM